MINRYKDIIKIFKENKYTDKLESRKRASIIVFKDDRIIVGEAKNDGHLELGGGGIEKNEKAKDAAIREVREEIGVDVKNVKFIKKIKNKINDGDFELTSYYYIADYDKDNKELWGEGPEGKLKRKIVSLDQYISSKIKELDSGKIKDEYILAIIKNDIDIYDLLENNSDLLKI